MLEQLEYDVSSSGKVITLKSIEGGKKIAYATDVEQRLSEVFGIKTDRIHQYIRSLREARYIAPQPRRVVRYEIKDVVYIVLALMATPIAVYAARAVDDLHELEPRCGSVTLPSNLDATTAIETRSEKLLVDDHSVTTLLEHLHSLMDQAGANAEIKGQLVQDITAMLALWLKSGNPGHIPALEVFQLANGVSYASVTVGGLLTDQGQPRDTTMYYYPPLMELGDQVSTRITLPRSAMQQVFSLFIQG